MTAFTSAYMSPATMLRQRSACTQNQSQNIPGTLEHTYLQIVLDAREERRDEMLPSQYAAFTRKHEL